MDAWVFELGQQWLQNMATDVSRYAMFAIGVWLVLSVLMAGVLARRKIRTTTPPSRQLLTEFFVSLRSIAI